MKKYIFRIYIGEDDGFSEWVRAESEYEARRSIEHDYPRTRRITLVSVEVR